MTLTDRVKRLQLPTVLFPRSVPKDEAEKLILFMAEHLGADRIHSFFQYTRFGEREEDGWKARDGAMRVKVELTMSSDLTLFFDPLKITDIIEL